jgi:LPS export ABC transporter protein LptC
VVASTLVSCRSKLGEAETLNLENVPLQRIENVFGTQSTNGDLEIRIEAPVMEHYDEEDQTYDYFPDGISVFAYTKEGLLESIILADEAKHTTPKRRNMNAEEMWEAFGNVVLHNVIKQQTMETDTIYWDRTNSEIYTDCYVKMYSPDGFMQGYGMESDQKASTAYILQPFNNYAVIIQDNTQVVIDSANFIGPLQKN